MDKQNVVYPYNGTLNFKNIFKDIYLALLLLLYYFIFGCVGSSLLHAVTIVSVYVKIRRGRRSSISARDNLSFANFLKAMGSFFLIFFLFLASLGVCCCPRAFSSCGEQGHSSLQCTGFLLQWLLLLWSTGSRRAGFSSCGMWAQ